MKESKYTVFSIGRCFSFQAHLSLMIKTYMDNFIFFLKFLICKKEKRTLTASIGNNLGDTLNLKHGDIATIPHHFDSAGQKSRSSGNENENRPNFFVNFWPLCLRGIFCVKFRTTSVASNLRRNHFIAACCVQISG